MSPIEAYAQSLLAQALALQAHIDSGATGFYVPDPDRAAYIAAIEFAEAERTKDLHQFNNCAQLCDILKDLLPGTVGKFGEWVFLPPGKPNQADPLGQRGYIGFFAK